LTKRESGLEFGQLPGSARTRGEPERTVPAEMRLRKSFEVWPKELVRSGQ